MRKAAIKLTSVNHLPYGKGWQSICHLSNWRRQSVNHISHGGGNGGTINFNPLLTGIFSPFNGDGAATGGGLQQGVGCNKGRGLQRREGSATGGKEQPTEHIYH